MFWFFCPQSDSDGLKSSQGNLLGPVDDKPVGTIITTSYSSVQPIASIVNMEGIAKSPLDVTDPVSHWFDLHSYNISVTNPGRKQSNTTESVEDFPFELITGSTHRIEMLQCKVEPVKKDYLFQLTRYTLQRKEPILDEVPINRCTQLEAWKDDVEKLKSILYRSELTFGKLNPRTGQIWLYVGGYYARKQNYDLAEDAFLHAAGCNEGLHPKVDMAYVIGEAFGNLGMIYMFRQHHVKAVESLKNALQWHELNATTNGRDPEGSLMVAHCLVKLGMAYSSGQKFDDAIDVLGRSIQVYQKAESGPYEEARVLDHLGQVFFRAGDFKEALDCHKAAFDLKVEAAKEVVHVDFKLAAQRLAANDNFDLAEGLYLISFRELSFVSTKLHLGQIYGSIHDCFMAEHSFASAIHIVKDVRSFFDNQGNHAALVRKLSFEMAEMFYNLACIMYGEGLKKRSMASLNGARRFYARAGLKGENPKVVDLMSAMLMPTQNKIVGETLPESE